MRVLLDGQLLEDAGTTLRSALDAAVLHAGDRMVIEATADGRPVPEADLENPPESDPYGAEIAFISADPRSLIVTMLHEAAETLERVTATQIRAAEQIQSGRLDDALSGLGEVLDAWGSVRRALQLIGDAHLTAAGGDPARHIGDLHRALPELVGQLTEMKRAVSSQDWSGLADVLAYELKDQAERWRGWLTRTAECLR